MLLRFYILSLGFVLSSCSTSLTHNESADIISLASLIENTFETAADNTETVIRDQRIRIQSDALEGIWFYTQLNTGVEEKLYRQRLSNLRLSANGTTIIQKTYGFKAPELYVNAWENTERLNALTPDDFESYFTKGCELVWRSVAQGEWTGYVDPQTCIVSSKRRNRDIRIESEVFLSKDIYRTNERGYEMDMTFLWGTKPGEAIELFPLN